MTKRRIEVEGEVLYLDDGYMHRTNGPAYRNTNILRWTWYMFDDLHRYYGPAVDGGDWWIKGDLVKEHE